MDQDPFREQYLPLDDMQKALCQDIKAAAMELFELMLRVDSEFDARAGHMARTRLEESVMWAIKGATGVRKKA